LTASNPIFKEHFISSPANLDGKIANCASYNEASKKCLEKNGFMLEGVKTKNLYYNGEWHDQFDYGLLL